MHKQYKIYTSLCSADQDHTQSVSHLISIEVSIILLTSQRCSWPMGAEDLAKPGNLEPADIFPDPNSCETDILVSVWTGLFGET